MSKQYSVNYAQLNEIVSTPMKQLERIFEHDVEVSVFVRNKVNPKAHVLFTNDSYEEIIKALQELQGDECETIIAKVRGFYDPSNND